MMKSSVARRYAAALFALAQETQSIDKIESELAGVIDFFKANEEARLAFEHELIPAAEKKALIRRLFGASVSNIVLNTLLVVIDKRRERYLAEIYQEFKAYANEARNIFEVEVRTAVELSDAEMKNLQDTLSSRIKKTVYLRKKVQPELIGGMALKIGDKVIDGTLKTRLERLRAAMAGR